MIKLNIGLEKLCGKTILTKKDGVEHLAYKIASVSRRLDKVQCYLISEPEYKQYLEFFTIEQAEQLFNDGEII